MALDLNVALEELLRRIFEFLRYRRKRSDVFSLKTSWNVKLLFNQGELSERWKKKSNESSTKLLSNTQNIPKIGPNVG